MCVCIYMFTPSLKYFFCFFLLIGHAVVPVANCGKQEYGAHPKQEMLLKDYLQYLSSDGAGSKQALQSCLYLKDWHFSRLYLIMRLYKSNALPILIVIITT